MAALPHAPFAVVARAQLLPGDTLKHVGRRREASESYAVAIVASDADDPLRIAARAHTALRTGP